MKCRKFLCKEFNYGVEVGCEITICNKPAGIFGKLFPVSVKVYCPNDSFWLNAEKSKVLIYSILKEFDYDIDKFKDGMSRFYKEIDE